MTDEEHSFRDTNNWQRLWWMVKNRRFWVLTWHFRDWDIYWQTYSCKFFKWPWLHVMFDSHHFYSRLFYFGIEAFEQYESDDPFINKINNAESPGELGEVISEILAMNGE